jgi:hypothetical protein
MIETPATNFAWNGDGSNPILVPTNRTMKRLTLEMPVSVLLPAPLTCCRWELERRHMVPPLVLLPTPPLLKAQLVGSVSCLGGK